MSLWGKANPHPTSPMMRFEKLGRILPGKTPLPLPLPGQAREGKSPVCFPPLARLEGGLRGEALHQYPCLIDKEHHEGGGSQRLPEGANTARSPP